MGDLIGFLKSLMIITFSGPLFSVCLHGERGIATPPLCCYTAKRVVHIPDIAVDSGSLLLHLDTQGVPSRLY